MSTLYYCKGGANAKTYFVRGLFLHLLPAATSAKFIKRFVACRQADKVPAVFVPKEKPHAKRVEGRKLKQRPPDIIEEGPSAKPKSGGRIKMSNDESSLSHTRWDCKYHNSVCAKVLQERNIWTVESRDRSDIERTVREKGSRDSRSNSMCGPHPHVGQDTAKNVCFQLRGISKGKKHADDIRETCQFEI